VASSALITDADLSRRAQFVIPGGMYGHQNTSYMSDKYPQFFDRGQGALITDVNGNEYVDLMCSWGPIVLGHCDPVVNDTVRAQMTMGDCLAGPSRHLVELAETFVDAVGDADDARQERNRRHHNVFDDRSGVHIAIRRSGGSRQLPRSRAMVHASSAGNTAQ
jgi:glutamate-1-semialdehyde aminotransferase